ASFRFRGCRRLSPGRGAGEGRAARRQGGARAGARKGAEEAWADARRDGVRSLKGEHGIYGITGLRSTDPCAPFATAGTPTARESRLGRGIRSQSGGRSMERLEDRAFARDASSRIPRKRIQNSTPAAPLRPPWNFASWRRRGDRPSCSKSSNASTRRLDPDLDDRSRSSSSMTNTLSVSKYGLALTGSDWVGLPLRIGHLPESGTV